MGFAILMVVSSIMVLHARAAEAELNLPSTSVFIEVSNGTESYFITRLSSVSLEADITNGTYLSWCVDVRAIMMRSPAAHEVRLFSSANPPSELANKSWDMVNYILARVWYSCCGYSRLCSSRVQSADCQSQLGLLAS